MSYTETYLGQLMDTQSSKDDLYYYTVIIDNGDSSDIDKCVRDVDIPDDVILHALSSKGNSCVAYADDTAKEYVLIVRTPQHTTRAFKAFKRDFTEIESILRDPSRTGFKKALQMLKEDPWKTERL